MSDTPSPQREAARRGFILVLAALIGLAAPAPAGAADDERVGGFAGWSPFAQVGLAVHMQKFNARGSSSIGISNSEAKVLSVLAARVGGGLRGPRIEALPGAPRLLVEAGIAVPARSSSTLLSETQTFGMPPIQDQRSAAFAVHWGSWWEASLGLEFPLELELFDIRLTPSIAYMGTRLRYEGRFSVRTPPTGNPRMPSMFFSIDGNASSTQHSMGPRLELEVAFAQVRRAQFSIFLDARAYWLLADARERSSFAGDIDGSAETGAVLFEAEQASGQVSFGIRGAFW